MNAVIVGSEGQLGRALQEAAPTGVRMIRHGSNSLDITDPRAVQTSIKAAAADVIFNAAAYTQVDKAESEEDRAYAVNATAVGYLAAAARSTGARLAHVSTDFVFDGSAGSSYKPAMQTGPLNAYGRTKLAGEVAAGHDALIVRTAWVYAPSGNNFVRTMLRLMAERPKVRVVSDQIGTPTYAPGLAGALWDLAAQGRTGIYHYTDSGACSWYDFAVAIQEEALAAGLLDKAIPIIPVNSEDYPTVARRPHFSVLDKTSTFAALGSPAPHWRVNLRKMIEQIRANG